MKPLLLACLTLTACSGRLPPREPTDDVMYEMCMDACEAKALGRSCDTRGLAQLCPDSCGPDALVETCVDERQVLRDCELAQKWRCDEEGTPGATGVACMVEGLQVAVCLLHDTSFFTDGWFDE